jgi:NADH-quinone oxidoreductase subunit M
MQRSLFGPYRLETEHELGRAPLHDIVPIVTLVVLIVALGVAPDLVFEMIRNATLDVINFDFGGGLS